jgi:hypothetical protein
MDSVKSKNSLLNLEVISAALIADTNPYKLWPIITTLYPLYLRSVSITKKYPLILKTKG